MIQLCQATSLGQRSRMIGPRTFSRSLAYPKTVLLTLDNDLVFCTTRPMCTEANVCQSLLSILLVPLPRLVTQLFCFFVTTLTFLEISQIIARGQGRWMGFTNSARSYLDFSSTKTLPLRNDLDCDIRWPKSQSSRASWGHLSVMCLRIS